MSIEEVFIMFLLYRSDNYQLKVGHKWHSLGIVEKHESWCESF